ncbi:MAG: polysaccharide pyruvyl transferase CsaB, partial [Defluviitaleaceae bacterium]|nr:polysaccharide pyruvyl transferase CsaB [Defluviitaleaceae bacterium]
MYKVLMATMSLDIGGAETHILELSKALQRRGLEVYVASNGGGFVAELEACGVKHYNVPLHTKRLSSLFKSYKMLKKIIIDNDIHLVHAHARIPAFICAMLRKKLGFRFVTTVHFVFSTAFPFNIISRWGEKSLAVSADLRKYLEDSYKVPAGNITDTVNGIDTEKFAPGRSCAGVEEEFRLEDGLFRIIDVRRMDKNNDGITYKLIEAAETLAEKRPGIQVILVGGGDDGDNIAKTVSEYNAKAGRRLIVYAGARHDVAGFLACGKIFVGNGRSALEAMSAGLPTILAGEHIYPGYLGIFREEVLKDAMDSNFTCRGFEEPTAEKIARDISKLMDMDDEELRKIGQYGRETVEKYYSVDRMCGDAMAVYESLRKPPKKPVDAVISGYYGFKNNGDDILLKSIIEGLRGLRPEINLVVLSRRPEETRKMYGVEAANRFNFFAVDALLKKSSMLVTGGGSLIQDQTSTKSLLYYLWVIDAAKRRGCRNMLYANGIGPVLRPKNASRAARTLNKADLITLRDGQSFDELRKFGVDKPEIKVTADAGFNLRETDRSGARKLLNSLGVGEGGKYFGVSVRSWKSNRPGFEGEIAAFADYAGEKYGLTPVFIPMRAADDAEISKRIIGLMRTPAVYLGTDYPVDVILDVEAGAEFVLGMRFHAVVYAMQSGTPVIGLIYGPKVKAVMDTFGQKLYRDVSDFDAGRLCAYADFIFENRDEIIEEISRFVGA